MKLKYIIFSLALACVASVIVFQSKVWQAGDSVVSSVEVSGQTEVRKIKGLYIGMPVRDFVNVMGVGFGTRIDVSGTITPMLDSAPIKLRGGLDESLPRRNDDMLGSVYGFKNEHLIVGDLYKKYISSLIGCAVNDVRVYCPIGGADYTSLDLGHWHSVKLWNGAADFQFSPDLALSSIGNALVLNLEANNNALLVDQFEKLDASADFEARMREIVLYIQSHYRKFDDGNWYDLRLGMLGLNNLKSSRSYRSVVFGFKLNWKSTGVDFKFSDGAITRITLSRIAVVRGFGVPDDNARRFAAKLSQSYGIVFHEKSSLNYGSVEDIGSWEGWLDDHTKVIVRQDMSMEILGQPKPVEKFD